jgi:Fe(3+) dicitrate transport protein
MINVKEVGISLFTSTSLFDARYHNAHVRSGNENINIDGNKVESVPDVISRNGLNIKFHQASISFLYSYTSESYADALNTEQPSVNGSVGLVPSYGILDLNSSFRFKNGVAVRFNINNLMNEKYFTKRPQFYPGPGVWSSDGRSFNVTLGIKI